MKIDRLIGIITILLQNDKVTAPELAERFEVSRRTINRDIDDICKAGIPIVSMQGYGGGISIESGYKLDKAVFTKEQLQAILYGLQGIDSISSSPYAVTIAERLSSKNNQIIADNTIIIDLASHYKDTLIKKIELIKKAVSDKRVIVFDYFSSKGENQYSVEPYRIVFKWSSWYVFGYCIEKNEFRLFKLNRLWNLTKTENTFDFALSRENAYFMIETPEGIRFSRDGSFVLNEEGRLVNKEGYAVLPREYIESPQYIDFVDGFQVEVDSDGNIYNRSLTNEELDEALLGGNIAVVSFENPKFLQKVGDNLYKYPEERMNEMEVLERSGAVRQGFLEKSNINVVYEMTGLIETNRLVEAYSKVLKTHMDDLNTEAITRLAARA